MAIPSTQRILGSLQYRFLRRLLALSLMVVMLASCKVELYSDLSEVQVNEMLSVLLEGGIDSTKKSQGKGMYTILVEKQRLAKAVGLLRANGLPGDQFAEIKDLYKKDGLISSPMEERVRYMFALSQSIAETLTNIDGVLTARVHVAVPEAEKFTGVIRPTSASVFIKYRQGFHLDGFRSEIKRIVESSIEGLSYQRIAVFMTPTVKADTVSVEEDLVVFGPFTITESLSSTFRWLALFVVSIFSICMVLIFILCSKLGYTAKINSKFKNSAAYRAVAKRIPKSSTDKLVAVSATRPVAKDKT